MHVFHVVSYMGPVTLVTAVLRAEKRSRRQEHVAFAAIPLDKVERFSLTDHMNFSGAQIRYNLGSTDRVKIVHERSDIQNAGVHLSTEEHLGMLGATASLHVFSLCAASKADSLRPLPGHTPNYSSLVLHGPPPPPRTNDNFHSCGC